MEAGVNSKETKRGGGDKRRILMFGRLALLNCLLSLLRLHQLRIASTLMLAEKLGGRLMFDVHFTLKAARQG